MGAALKSLRRAIRPSSRKRETCYPSPMPKPTKEFPDADRLHRGIGDLKKELKGIRLFLSTLATKIGLKCTENKIMSKISEYVEAVQTGYTEIGNAVDEIGASVGGIQTDITNLKDIIEKLQNNPGPISPEDQALLDNSVTLVNSLATKVKAAAAAIKELDAQTETAPEAPPA